MRKVAAILFHILAGFFVYMVSLLAFLDQSALAKWAMMVGFSLPVLLFLFLGLTMNRFHRWRRDVGVVLLSGTGFTFFLVFTFVCLLTSEEFKTSMPPESLSVFSSYLFGSIFLLGVAALGVAFLRADMKPAAPSV